MKKSIKAVSLAMALGMSLSFGACKTGGENQWNEKLDDSKTQLYIKYYGGGLNTKWIDTIVSDFETAYANYQGKDGKVGVQVRKDYKKENPDATKVKSPSNDSEVFIIENVDYNDFIANNALLDITDIVQGGAVEKNGSVENVTIESKMDESCREFYNVGTESAAKYYALPYYTSSIYLNYDINLFTEKNLYFAKGKTADGMESFDLNSILELFVEDETAERAAGPDGVEGTDDDGLPATFADFNALIAMMKNLNITPFMFNGNAHHYLKTLANEVWAHSEGSDGFKVNLSWEGEVSGLLNKDTLEVENKTVKITKENAYELQRQKGKYDAIEFISMIVEDPNNYYESSFDTSWKHLNAQKSFIKSGRAEGYEEEYGFLIDGMWWTIEGVDNFDGDADWSNKEDRNYGILPLPWATREEVGSPITTLSQGATAVFIKKNCPEEHLELAKAFVKFMHSESSLNTFSSYTNMVRPYTYSLTEESKTKMGSYGIAGEKFLHGENVTVLQYLPMSDLTVRNYGTFQSTHYGFVLDGVNQNPADYLKMKMDKANTVVQKQAAVDDFFQSLADSYQKNWGTLCK